MSDTEVDLPDLIVKAGKLLIGIDANSDAEVIDLAGLTVEDGKVVRVGSFATLAREFPDVNVVGSFSDLVFPGLVNAHHHSGLTPLQMGTPSLPLELWLPRFAAWRPIDAYLDTLYSAIEMIESGVTTVHHIQGGPRGEPSDWIAQPERVMAAYSDIGMRAAYSFMWSDRNAIVYGDDDDFLATLPPDLRGEVAANLTSDTATDERLSDYLNELVERWGTGGDGLTAVQLAPANLQWCSDASLAVQKRQAEWHGLKMHMHLLETPYQREFARRTHGRSAVAHLCDLGLLGPNMTLGHCIWASEEDIALLASSGTCVCHNPSSGLRLQSGIAPVSEMRAAGVKVGLGIDQAGINDDRDMLQEMRVAWNLQRTPGHDHLALSAGEVLRMATEHAAGTTAFAARIGRLSPGMAADFAVIDLNALTAPYCDDETGLADLLLQRSKTAMVNHVYVAGKPVMQDRRILGIDKAALLADIAISLQAPLSDNEVGARSMVKRLDPHLRAFYAGWDMPAGRAFRSWNAR